MKTILPKACFGLLLFILLLQVPSTCLAQSEEEIAEQQHKLLKKEAKDNDTPLQAAQGPVKPEHMWGAAWKDEAYIPTKAPGAQWFEQAEMGIFLHWGLSSQSPKPSTEISWSMLKNLPWDPDNKGTLTPNEYFKLAESFDPQNYNPEKWIHAARRAGFTYAVLTTKHHEGYALWPSEYGDFSTKQYLNGRDLVGPFIEACRKYGVKAGLYYSPPDFYFNREYISFNFESTWGASPQDSPKRRPAGLDHEVIERKPMPKDWPQKYKDFTGNQVRELLTRYGKIDILWFDGGPEGISMEEIRQLQPDILVNPRMHGVGDFETFECRYPEEKPKSQWWELCMSMKTVGWGYMNNEQYSDISAILEWLVKTRSMGGRLLANIGPRPDGTLPEAAYQRLDELYSWMQIHRESVSGIEPGYWLELSDYPLSMRNGTWYLHLIPTLQTPVEIKTEQVPRRVVLMRTGEPAAFEQKDGKLVIDLKPAMRSGPLDVLKISW